MAIRSYLPSENQLVAVDFSIGGRQRAELRLDALGQVDVSDLLRDPLPGPVGLGALLELHLDQRKAEDGPRADRLDAGNAEHRVFDGDRNLALDLLGRPARKYGDDLHHLGRDVGVGVDRLLLEGPDAPTHDPQRQEQHHPSQSQCRLNDEVHRPLPPWPRPPCATIPRTAPARRPRLWERSPPIGGSERRPV